MGDTPENIKKNRNIVDQLDKNLPDEVIETMKKRKVIKLTGEDHDNVDDVYYFKVPDKADINRYISLVSKQKAGRAMRTLIEDCVVYPELKELKKRFEELPGLSVALSNMLQSVVGINQDFSVKKL